VGGRPDQAIWIPPDAPHELQSHGPFSGWSLYLAPVACARLPARACVLGTTALLRTLVERVAEWAVDAVLDAAQERFAAVVVDEISRMQPEAVSLPAPSDPRLQRVAGAIAKDPADVRGLHDWARIAAMSPRSLTRRFAADRDEPLLLAATGAPACGGGAVGARRTGDPGGDLGYDSPSAFSAAFRRAHGCSPTDYVARLHVGDHGSI
jgi:AraC-like DNA-binding protein